MTKNNINTSKQLEVDFQKEALRREEIKNFDKSFKSIEKEKNLFETHFVQSSDIVPFLNKIEKMATSVGTEVEVSFIELADDNSGLFVKMKDTGTFFQVYKFINLLENSPYELEFVTVDMNSIIIEDSEKELKNNKKDQWEALIKIKLISFL